MALTGSDVAAIQAVRFVYRPRHDDGPGGTNRWQVEQANVLLRGLAAAVCAALNATLAGDEELRHIEPITTWTSGIGGLRVRYDLLALTDRWIHFVQSGTETGTVRHTFAYGTLDAETKLMKMTPELVAQGGRAVLVMPRLSGREETWDRLLAAPPPSRTDSLGGPAWSPPPGWHPDPARRHELRWWDGARWTEHASTGGVTVVDPVTP